MYPVGAWERTRAPAAAIRVLRVTAKHLLAIGGAHIDRRGQITGAYAPGASNPGTLSAEVGGVVFNAARNAAGRGVAVSLVSVRGGDAGGEAVAKAIAAAGIADLSSVFLDRTTASYTALIDRDGELIAGLADMELYEQAFPRVLSRSSFRDIATRADAVLCDANLPEAAIGRVATAAGGPVHGVAISPAKAVRYIPHLERLACLFLNLREAGAIAGLAADSPVNDLIAALRGKGLASAVLTAGPGPLTAYDANGAFAITPPTPRRVADVTGAGDAIAGVTIAALMQGRPLADAVRAGMAAAMLTIERPAAVTAISDTALAEALKLVPGPEPMR
ncbi:MAG: carbohydrate kinase family protein [Rhizobiaceae bacterium]